MNMATVDAHGMFYRHSRIVVFMPLCVTVRRGMMYGIIV